MTLSTDHSYTNCLITALPERCDMASDAGVQTGENIPGNKAERNVESCYIS